MHEAHFPGGILYSSLGNVSDRIDHSIHVILSLSGILTWKGMNIFKDFKLLYVIIYMNVYKLFIIHKRNLCNLMCPVKVLFSSIIYNKPLH